jgi:uncharacterized glyoxalase superfamily protein PhnB
MAVQPVPDGYNTVSPYLAVEDAAAAIDYYKKAFGATERVRMEAPDGKIGHAELEIGDSIVMLADPFPRRARSRRTSSAVRARASSSTSRTSTRWSSARSRPERR